MFTEQQVNMGGVLHVTLRAICIENLCLARFGGWKWASETENASPQHQSLFLGFNLLVPASSKVVIGPHDVNSVTVKKNGSIFL